MESFNVKDVQFNDLKMDDDGYWRNRFVEEEGELYLPQLTQISGVYDENVLKLIYQKILEYGSGKYSKVIFAEC